MLLAARSQDEKKKGGGGTFWKGDFPPYEARLRMSAHGRWVPGRKLIVEGGGPSPPMKPGYCREECQLEAV